MFYILEVSPVNWLNRNINITLKVIDLKKDISGLELGI